MQNKRKDTKGRILRRGEFQRKDGKYEYKYVDSTGTRRSVYSWKLVQTDKVSQQRNKGKALRDIEKDIEKDMLDMCGEYYISSPTLNEVFDAFISNSAGLRLSTINAYTFTYNANVRNDIGKKKVSEIRYSDIKQFYVSLARDKGLKANTVASVHRIITQLLRISERDGYIRKNPSTGALSDVVKMCNLETEKKRPLSEKEMQLFFFYAKNSPKWSWFYPLYSLLLWTGCRIGEALALTWDDCNFEEGTISVSKTLKRATGKTYLSKPKSDAGTRIIPMLPKARDALLYVKKHPEMYSTNVVIDGHSGFLFKDSVGGVLSAYRADMVIRYIVDEINEHEKENGFEMPRFSCHCFRHTFCSMLCEKDVNIKVIQEVMGHSSINVTMDIYGSVSTKKKIDAIRALENIG